MSTSRLAGELFGHGAAGIGGDVLQVGRRVVGRWPKRRSYARAREIAASFSMVRGDPDCFWADGNVDAGDVAAALGDDRVDPDCCLAGLAVADDQLALATADGDHRVDP